MFSLLLTLDTLNTQSRPYIQKMLLNTEQAYAFLDQLSAHSSHNDSIYCLMCHPIWISVPEIAQPLCPPKVLYQIALYNIFKVYLPTSTAALMKFITPS